MDQGHMVHSGARALKRQCANADSKSTFVRQAASIELNFGINASRKRHTTAQAAGASYRYSDSDDTFR